MNTERVNYATLLERLGWTERDLDPAHYGENERVIVMLSRREAIAQGFPGWEFSKLSNELFELTKLEDFG